MLLAVGVANAQDCSNSISACGCTISSAGIYNVDSDLNATQGLTSYGSCIDVAADNVKLFTNAHNITGAGSGVGIHLRSKARNVFLSSAGPRETYTTISGWKYGLESEADKVTAEGFLFNGNTTGVLLNGAENNHIGCFESFNNSVYGVWILNGSGNQIDYAAMWNNRVAGIYIGCSSTGPSGQACTEEHGASSGNFIFEDYSYSPGVSTQSYGIAVEQGSTQNSIVDNWFDGNTVDGYFDGNTEGANLWHSNRYVTANQSFIQ